MKTIYRLSLLLFLPSLLATSCRFEDDEYFDRSAALRIEETSTSVEQTLVAAENGWLMQYFPGTDVGYFPGFNLFLRFSDNGKVLIASDHEFLRNERSGLYTEHTSLYDIILEDGPVLSFSTWNDVLTPLADPVNPYRAPATILKDGAGMGGDYNLVIMSYDTTLVELRGERHGGLVRMVPAEPSWEDYLARTEHMRRHITDETLDEYVVTDGTETKYITGLNKRRISLGERAVDPLHYDSLRCVFTPSGFRLEKPGKIGQTEFTEMHISADSTKLVSPDGAVTIYAIWQKALLPLITNKASDGMMVIDENSLSDELREHIATVKNNITRVNRAFQYAAIGFGKSMDGENIINGLILKYYDRSKHEYGFASLQMDVVVDEKNDISIGYKGEVALTNNNMGKFFNNVAVKTAINSIAEALAGDYNVTPNNYWHPDGAIFSSKTDATQFRLDFVK